MRPQRPQLVVSDATARAQIRALVEASTSSEAWLAMVGDKRLFLAESGGAFVMYGIQGRSWIAMGDPIGPESLWEDLLWDFRELVDLFVELLLWGKMQGYRWFNLGMAPLSGLERHPLAPA